MKKYFNLNIKFLLLFSLFTFSFIIEDFPLIGYGFYYVVPTIYFIFNFNYIIKLIKSFFIKKNIAIVGILILFVLLLFLFPVLYGTNDFTYFTIKIMNMLKTLYRLLFIVIVFKKHISPEGDAILFFKYFIASCCLYILFTIITLIFPDFKLFWFNHVRQTDLQYELVYKQANYITRFGWTGFAGFKETFYCSFAIILQMYISLKHVKTINWKDCGIICFLVLGNLFYGRTGLVVTVGLSACFFIILLFQNRKWAIRFAFSGVAMFIIITILGNTISFLKPWYQWVFSMFYSYSNGTGFRTGSTDIILHQMIFMPEIKTFLFGDGMYTLSSGSYYMHTDIGFMRPLLFGGILFSIVRYLAILIPVCMYTKLRYLKDKNKLEYFLFAGIGFLIVMFECKGEVVEDMIIWFMLFICLEFLNQSDKKIKKNLCLLVDDISRTRGGNRVAVNLANELALDYNVHLLGIGGKGKQLPFDISDDVKCDALSDEAPRMRKNLLKGSVGLRKYLKKQEIDVIFTIGAGMNMYMFLGTMAFDVKKIFCEHSNLNNKYYNDTMQKICQFLGAYFSDKVVTLTEKDKRKYIKKFHIAMNKVLYIYNWKDPMQVPKNTVRENRIVSVGGIEPVKGYERLIEIATPILNRHTDWVWEIYGDGKSDYLNELKRLIKENDLEDRLIFKGVTKDIELVYQKSKICVLTSYYEGLPMVLLESLANGLPVVSFDIDTGPNEIIKDGENGYLVEDGNITEMVEKINDLIENETILKSMSNEAPMSIDKFSKEKIVTEWKSILNGL